MLNLFMQAIDALTFEHKASQTNEQSCSAWLERKVLLLFIIILPWLLQLCFFQRARVWWIKGSNKIVFKWPAPHLHIQEGQYWLTSVSQFPLPVSLPTLSLYYVNTLMIIAILGTYSEQHRCTENQLNQWFKPLSRFTSAQPFLNIDL